MIVPSVFAEKELFTFEERENTWENGGFGSGTSIFLIINGELQDNGFVTIITEGVFPRSSMTMTTEESMSFSAGTIEKQIASNDGMKEGEEYTITVKNGDYTASLKWIPLPTPVILEADGVKYTLSDEQLAKVNIKSIEVMSIFEGSMDNRWFTIIKLCSGEKTMIKPTIVIHSDIESTFHILMKSINPLSCAHQEIQVKAIDPETITFHLETAETGDDEEVNQLRNELKELKEMIKEEQIVAIVEEQIVAIVEEQSATQEKSEGGGCLIATATYGSEMSQQVQQLRELRDNQLLQTQSGTSFMSTFNDIYYSFSPIIADYERENPYFKEAVKLTITPMISSLSLMENANSESEVLSIGISVIALNIGMYLGVPAIVIVGIRKRF